MVKKHISTQTIQNPVHHKPKIIARIPARFQQAIKLHEQGEIDAAEVIYRDILRVVPGHFDALLFLGHLYLHSGRIQHAAEITRRAIAENRHHPVAHFNLGLALIGLAQHDQALTCFEHAIALQPDYAEAHGNRGVVLQNLMKYREAIACFDQAIACQPANEMAFSNRGVSLQKLGKNSEAMASFDRALELNPQNEVAHNNRGISQLGLRRYDEALLDFDRALELNPDYAEAYSNRGLALQYAGRNEEAIASFDKALELNPENSQAYNHRGMSLLEVGRYDQAMASLDRALGSSPDSVEVLNNRGLALQYIGRYEDALLCFNQALELKPAQPGTLSHIGNALRDLNRNSEALTNYDAALLNDHENATSHLNASLCHLLQGNFSRGWEEFEWRWQTEQYRDSRRIFEQPLWLGKEELKGKTILLHAEQGFGDTLQFSRYATLLAAQGATVVLEVPAVLKSLMTSLQGVSRVVIPEEAHPAFDYHCPLMSLPLAFKTDHASIPCSLRYLAGEDERIAMWGNMLGRSNRPRVGLAWSGNPVFANDRNRSIPLARLIKLVSDQADFVSLQRDLRPADQALLEAHSEIKHFGEQLRDFSDAAALVANMDLVITVDTAMAHLAGALGKPVWIVLPFNCDWRWQLNRSDSPWYPSARLFRQTRPGGWDEVIEGLVKELSETPLLARH